MRSSEDDDDDELREQIEEGFGERYIGIPHQGSDAGYRDMAEFIDPVTDDRLRALRGHRAHHTATALGLKSTRWCGAIRPIV